MRRSASTARAAGSPAGADRRVARALTALVTAAAVAAADQVTKTWALHHTVTPRHVLGPLWLTLELNSGAAFSIGRGVTPVVEAAVVVILVGVLAASRRAIGRAAPLDAVAVGLLLGGALSNLGDRLLRHHHGAVIDWIDALQIGNHRYWPVFNLADACIVVGAAALALRLSHSGRGS